MKVEEQAVATFNVGRMETAVAGIQASAKAFEILSSGLYSDAEFAIVREIAANAWDSHKAAGNTDKPFRVQVPTHLDPRFCVRDYGTSMSHQFMMTRVNTYFDSTKNDSNDEIGGFGLGIKSVFSYTTSFMIACFQGGTRRVYVYQIGEQGLPEISLMAENATTEPDGVEVSVPVKEEDYRKFRLAIQKTFAFYEVKPEVYGVELEIPEFKKVVEGSNWFVCGRHEVFDRDIYVEMGGIAYPVENNIADLHFYGRGQTVFLKASIGDIDITPNREQVKLTDRTRKFISATIETIRQEVSDVIQAKVDDSKFTNYWEMIEFVNQFKSDLIVKLGFKATEVTFNGKAYDTDHFRFRTVPAPKLSDPNDPESAMVLATVTDEMVPGFKSYTTWELTHTGRVKKKDNSYRDRFQFSIDRFNRPNTMVVMEERQGVHVARWMKSTGTRFVTTIDAAVGTAKDVVTKIKSLIEDFPNVYNAADLTYDKDQFKIAKVGDRKLYIYRSGTWEAVTREEVNYASLPATINYFLTDGRQKGVLLGRERDFKHETEFMNTLSNWTGGHIYYLTDAMVAKITKNRPDVSLELVADKLEALTLQRVKAAAGNYFANDLESMIAPLSKSSGRWRVDAAVQHWSNVFGLTDFTDATNILKGNKPDKGLEKMVRAVMGKSIFEVFADQNITVPSVSMPNFDTLVAKMPYAYALVEDYLDQFNVDRTEKIVELFELLDKNTPKP